MHALLAPPCTSLSPCFHRVLTSECILPELLGSLRNASHSSGSCSKGRRTCHVLRLYSGEGAGEAQPHPAPSQPLASPWHTHAHAHAHAHHVHAHACVYRSHIVAVAALLEEVPIKVHVHAALVRLDHAVLQPRLQGCHVHSNVGLQWCAQSAVRLQCVCSASAVRLQCVCSVRGSALACRECGMCMHECMCACAWMKSSSISTESTKSGWSARGMSRSPSWEGERGGEGRVMGWARGRHTSTYHALSTRRLPGRMTSGTERLR